MHIQHYNFCTHLASCFISASNLNEVDSDAEGTGHYGDPFEVKSLTDDDADLRVGESKSFKI